MLHGIPFDLVVWSNRFFQLIADDHSGAFSRGSTGKKHDSSASIRISSFQKANGDTKSDAGASKRTLIVGDGPWVACQGFQNACQLELALLNWQQETGSTKSSLWHWLTWAWCSTALWTKTEHILDLFWLIFLSATENVWLAAFSIADLMNWGLVGFWVSYLIIVRNAKNDTMVP